MPVGVQIFLNKKLSYERVVKEDALIVRDEPVEIPLNGAKEINIRLYNAYGDNLYGKFDFYALVFGNLEFEETETQHEKEGTSDVPAKPATA